VAVLPRILVVALEYTDASSAVVFPLARFTPTKNHTGRVARPYHLVAAIESLPPREGMCL